MFLRMEVSLDDLLNEVERAMVEDASTCREEIPSAVANTSEWSHPPSFTSYPDPFRATKKEERNREKATTVIPTAVVGSSGNPDTIVGITNTPEALRVPADFDASDDEVDALLKLVTVAQENRSVRPLWHCGGGERSDGTKQVPVPNDIAGDGFDDDVDIPVNGSATATPSAGEHDRQNIIGSASVLSAPEATVSKKQRKCGTVCLAGTAIRRGYCASSLSQCACDALRCTDCNFEVLCFDGRAWGEDTDYIFLRNNAPDPVKLSARLQPAPDTFAYACQCSWRSVVELCILSPMERPRWVCGGH